MVVYIGENYHPNDIQDTWNTQINEYKFYIGVVKVVEEEDGENG